MDTVTDLPSHTKTPSPTVVTVGQQSSNETNADLTSTINKLETEEQRKVLDAVTELRKCGLDSILSLPDIVVCGDQSAGKSSVLEALTEIPFPRNDNLCTRFATEINLRRGATESFTVKVIPDSDRTKVDQNRVKDFSESATNIGQLPTIIEAAMRVMGIAETGTDNDMQSEQLKKNAFSKDTLSIEINGPQRPQLTVIDIPGLIQSSTKGVSEQDVAMASQITSRYIKRPRTICLAVIAGTNDAANQSILQRVRKVDPSGRRTLGVITKPDQLPAGSGSESKFLELAQNKDVFFNLGWHVVRNRGFNEKDFSLSERDEAEAAFFRQSNFNILPPDMVGIAALRIRLSLLLFEHVKSELPQLNAELEKTLESERRQLQMLGSSRSSPAACRVYLTQLYIDCQEVCKSALHGNYDHEYFKAGVDEDFSSRKKSTIARLRAVVQYINSEFSEKLRTEGHKYHLAMDDEQETVEEAKAPNPGFMTPTRLSKKESVAWVKKMLQRSRGRELMGNFNPYLVGELFWEQSEPWERFARKHMDDISQLCERFLADLLEQKAPKDIKSRVWAKMVLVMIKRRKSAASDELSKLLQDLRDFPINYNHYYTDVIERQRHKRLEKRLKTILPESIPHISHMKCSVGKHYEKYSPAFDTNAVIHSAMQSNTTTVDMDKFSVDEAIDCMRSIYKVHYKTFVANVTTQVIERHLMRGLDKLFSPLSVVTMTDREVEAMVSEQPATKQLRFSLEGKLQMLEEGQQIFQELVGAQLMPDWSDEKDRLETPETPETPEALETPETSE